MSAKHKVFTLLEQVLFQGGEIAYSHIILYVNSDKVYVVDGGQKEGVFKTHSLADAVREFCRLAEIAEKFK